MESYSIEVKRSASKEIEKLPPDVLRRIVDKIASLKTDPRPDGCKKLAGHNKCRVRVGDYRILYKIEDKLLIVYVVKVGHRRDIYE